MGDITFKLQDLRHLDWTESVNTSGTGGSFLKARLGSGASARYFKLSCSDEYRGIYGHECVNELIASRLMDVLGVEHLHYRLIHALVRVGADEHQTWLSASKSFRRRGEKKQGLNLFYSLNKLDSESPYDLCVRFGWGPAIERMMLVDYLIANRDRHGANIEVLRSPGGDVRLAPPFDNGLSFVFSCYGDEERVRAFDPLADVNANNYIGSRSLEDNLMRFKVNPAVNDLTQDDRPRLLAGLDRVLPCAHLEKIWQMLWQRWCRFEELRDR